MLSSVQLSYLETGLKGAAATDWAGIGAAIRKGDYLDAASTSLQDALDVVSPFVPQARVAAAVIKLATSIVDSAPGPGQAFDMKTFLKSVTAAEGVDWSGLHDALMSDNAFLASVIVAQDLERIASPFVPPPYGMIADTALTALVFIGKHGRPADPSEPVMRAREGDGQVM